MKLPKTLSNGTFIRIHSITYKGKLGIISKFNGYKNVLGTLIPYYTVKLSNGKEIFADGMLLEIK